MLYFFIYYHGKDKSLIEAWCVEKEQIRMRDDSGNLYYLENCLPPDGIDAANVNPFPRYNVLGQLYKNREDIGVWILHSNDKQQGFIHPKES